MPILLKEISAEERKKLKGLPPVKEHETKFPKRAAGSASEAKAELRDWQKKQEPPKPPKNPEVKIKAVPPTAANVAKIAAISESDAAPAEIVKQKLDEETFFGTLFSSLAIHEYTRLEGEYKKRKASARTASTADRDWAQVVEGFQSAFAAAGLKVNEAQLSKWSKELAGNKRNLEATARIANSRVSSGAAVTEDVGSLTASFLTAAATYVDLNVLTVAIPNLCSQPFAQGTLTKFWSRSWSLTASIPYPCPTWTNPFRICWSTVTIATVTVNLSLNVGYRVSCCGASAWGQASAQACASVAGISKCVGCTATIVGVAGFSRVAISASQCSYGLGINAGVQCQVFGATVFNASWSFGYTVTGPCPPAGLC